MSDEPKKRRWPRGIGWTLLLATLLLYPLSMGPAFWLVVKTNTAWARTCYGVVYAPIVSACKLSPLVKDAMQSYIEWWQPFDR
jgi:hypothetical protein